MGFFSGLVSSILPTVGKVVGGLIGGSLGGVSSSVIGGSLGTAAGSAVQSVSDQSSADDAARAATEAAGGLTTPKTATGQEIGVETRDYFDEAFPGTNPWERLGTSSPMGAVAVGAEASRAQRSGAAVAAGSAARQVQRQAKVQTSIAAANVATQRRGQTIQGRAQGVQAGAQYGPQYATGLGDYITTGKVPSDLPAQAAPGVSAEASRLGAGAAVSRAYTDKFRAQFQREHTEAQISSMFKSLTDASAAANRLQGFRIALRSGDLKGWIVKNSQALQVVGLGADELGRIASALGMPLAALRLGRLFKGQSSLKGAR